MLPVIRYGNRSAPRRRPVADVLLGVSRRRRQAAYVAIGGGLRLLLPMLRRLGIAAALLALVPIVSWYVRLIL